MDVTTIVSGFLALVGLISSGVAAVFASSLKTLRNGVNDLRERVKDLESERDHLKEKLATREAEHETTKADLTSLQKVVTGEVHLVAIEQRLEEHHDEAIRAWTKISTILDRIIIRMGAT